MEFIIHITKYLYIDIQTNLFSSMIKIVLFDVFYHKYYKFLQVIKNLSCFSKKNITTIPIEKNF